MAAAARLPYPDKFHAAAAYAGFGDGNVGRGPIFDAEMAQLLYGIYMQATSGPCKTSKPPICTEDHYLWKAWREYRDMPSDDAMRLFVRTLEGFYPDWYLKSQVKNGDYSTPKLLEMKRDLEAALASSQDENNKLRSELSSTSNELSKVRGQFVAEQSRCFKLEVEVAELRQKLQSMERKRKRF